jgi:monofunctional biosynthetic peptidoglycan transglycosylase
MKIVRRLGTLSILAVIGLYGSIALSLVYLRYLPPLTTGVQIQRRAEALATGSDYTKRYRFVPREKISQPLRRAVVAAEDTRFYQHRGFDWEELRIARETAARSGTAPRGASTISQQLVKNLYFTTHRSYLRKGIEMTVTPFAELILGKERILELYLNVIEWGPGIYGAEEAARYHYGVAAADISRERAARMAAVIPAPLSRTPERMGSYANTIQARMRAMGW